MDRMADAAFTAVDLSRMVAPNIIETLGHETLLADAVAHFKEEMDAAGLTFENRDSDPATKLLQTFVYLAQLLRQRVNDAARAVMPAYAVARIWTTSPRCSASLASPSRLPIPCSGPRLLWKAMRTSAAAWCLRPRAIRSPGQRANVSLALAADTNVLDASATNPSPGAVVVSVLSHAGSGAASQALLDNVAAYVSDETRRPLTDFVPLQSAQIIEYAVVAAIKTFSGPDGSVVMDAAQASLNAYVAERHRMGRDITRSALFRAIHVEGVQNVG